MCGFLRGARNSRICTWFLYACSRHEIQTDQSENGSSKLRALLQPSPVSVFFAQFPPAKSLRDMPSTPTKENGGRLRSFKNRGKDQDVSRARCFNTIPYVYFSPSFLVGDAKTQKRRDSGAQKGELLSRQVLAVCST